MVLLKNAYYVFCVNEKDKIDYKSLRDCPLKLEHAQFGTTNSTIDKFHAKCRDKFVALGFLSFLHNNMREQTSYTSSRI